jgi:hypothetical protein
MLDLSTSKGKIILGTVLLVLLVPLIYLLVFKGFREGDVDLENEEKCNQEIMVDGITLCVKHQLGNNWDYEVVGTLPDICHLIELEYVSEDDFPPSTVDFNLSITPPSSDTLCIEGSREIEEKGSFKMEKEGKVNFNILTLSDSESVYIDESKSITLNEDDIVIVSAKYKLSTGYNPFYPEFDTNHLEMIRFEDEDKGTGLMGGDLTIRTYYFRVSGVTISTKLRVGIHQSWNSENTKEVQKEVDIKILSQDQSGI